MARRATVINSVREAATSPVLVLDAGGTLFGQPLADESEGKIIVEAMNVMAYDALAVGDLELQQGLDVLRQRAAEMQFALLSCNIVGAQDGKPIFSPYTIVEDGGLRIGIIGVSEIMLGGLPGLGNAALVQDPLVGLRRYLPEVRALSDVVVLLSHLGLEADKAVAEMEPGIQVIVGGRTRRLLMAPELVGTTVIVQAGYDGEWLGRLDLTFDEKWQPVDPRVEIVTLDPSVVDDPTLAALVESYR